MYGRTAQGSLVRLALDEPIYNNKPAAPSVAPSRTYGKTKSRRYAPRMWSDGTSPIGSGPWKPCTTRRWLPEPGFKLGHYRVAHSHCNALTISLKVSREISTAAPERKLRSASSPLTLSSRAANGRHFLNGPGDLSSSSRSRCNNCRLFASISSFRPGSAPPIEA